MHEAILAAAAAVNALAPEVPGAQNAPACTLVGAVVSGGLLTIGWVGDSRAYWVPDDRAALPGGSPRTTPGRPRWSRPA